jgi:phospholipid/cholesterol/gamma-HCH transport system ATP-binding protein
MRRFRFGATGSGDDQPNAEASAPQGPQASAASSSGGPWGAGRGDAASGSEQPTQEQGSPSDQPAPIEPRTGAERWSPPQPSREQEAARGEQDSQSDDEPPTQEHRGEGTSEADGDGARSEEGGRQAEGDRGSDPQGEAQGESEGESEEQEQSRVSVVDEQESRPAPPDEASEEEYKWHTYKQYPSGRPDAVEFIDMYKAFGSSAKILRGLNMGLPEGMVSMILGPSGTGKSVCIKHMVGLLYPDAGDVLVHGESVPNMPDDDLFEMRKKFGLLFQDGALFGSMNMFDNIAFPLRQHTEKSEDEVTDIVQQRLDEVGLGADADKMPNELSGGMRKRAGFARALVLEPDIVLFDEPDSGLDPVRTALLGELILEIHRDMMETAKEKQKEHLPTFTVITHDIMSARRVADYINVLWKGRIVEAGPAEDMLNSDNPFIRQFLSGESEGPLTMD